MPNQKYAYVTVLTTESYLIGVFALKESLNRVKAKYPLVVLVNDNITDASISKMKDFGIEVMKIKSIEIPESIMSKNAGTNYNRWTNTFDKLRMFGLTEFDKFVYLDSDMYIRKNIDELFEAENMSAVVDRHYCTVDPNYLELTSGVLVIVPEKDLDIKIAEKITQVMNKYDQFGDQDVIQEYYSDWKLKENLHLSVIYNMFILHLDYYIKDEVKSDFNYRDFQKVNFDDLKIIHFICKKKPWQFTIDQIDEYIDFLNDVRQKDYLDCDVEEQKKMFEAEFSLGRKYTKIVSLEYMDIIKSVSDKI